ncbi:MAG: hypothetical protein ACRYG2_16345 [Janthinobacterium lividum]
MRGRILLVLLAAVVVLAGTSVAFWFTHREVPVVVDPACPALLSNTTNAAVDFADVVTWGGRTYVRAEDGPDWVLGDVTGVVGCSVGEMDNPKGWQVATGPWPDGTATRLPRGTALRDAGEHALVAEEPGSLTLYCEGDPGTLAPTC